MHCKLVPDMRVGCNTKHIITVSLPSFPFLQKNYRIAVTQTSVEILKE